MATGHFLRFNTLVDTLLGRLSHGELATLLVFLRHADVHGNTRPSENLVAQRLGCSQRSAQRYVASLTAKGLLQTRAGGYPGRAAERIVRLEPGPTPDNSGGNTRQDAPARPPESGASPATNPPHTRHRVADQQQEQTITNHHHSGGVSSEKILPTAPPSAAEPVAFLAQIGVNDTPAIRTGLAAGRYTHAELQALWKHIVNTRPPGQRQAAMAQAVMDTRRPPPPARPTALPETPTFETFAVPLGTLLRQACVKRPVSPEPVCHGQARVRRRNS